MTQNKPFAADVRLFRTIAEFVAYLQTQQRPAWCIGATVHHTAIPTVPQWQAAGWYKSTWGMIAHWRDTNGWSAGPHLVIAPEGIIQVTPVTQRGVHGGPCNDDRIGIEVVGNYNRIFWQDPIKTYAYGALIALFQWLGVSPQQIVTGKRLNGHKECMAGRECPGNAINLDKLRSDVATMLEAATVGRDPQVLGVSPTITQRQFTAYIRRYPSVRLLDAEIVRIYTLCSWLQLDPAFLLGVARHASKDGMMDTAPQQETSSPLPIAAALSEWRPTWRDPSVDGGSLYHRYESHQLGFMATILHLKNVYGMEGRVTARAIFERLFGITTTEALDVTVAKYVDRVNDMLKAPA